MDSWIRFWAVFLGTSLAGFTLLAIVVTVGGWRDLREMLAELKRRSES